MGSVGRANTRWWRAAAAGGAWLLCVTWARTALATPFDLAWNAPAGCPSREQMIDATRARLGESETTASPEVFVRGTVVAEKGAFVVTFLMKDPSGAELGERTMRVQGRVCRAIEEPAALVLATMISVVTPRAELAAGPPPAASDAAKGGETPSSRGATNTRATSTAAVPGGAAVPEGAAPPKPSPLARLALGASGVASTSVLPKAGFGVVLRTTYSSGSIFVFGFETGFEAGAWVQAQRGEVGFQFLSAAALVGLRALRSSEFEIAPVLTLRGGVLRTVPTGFQIVKAVAHPMALAGVGALLRTPLARHLYAEALPQAEIILVRDVFEASEGTTTYFLHQPAAIGARLSLGVAYEFP